MFATGVSLEQTIRLVVCRRVRVHPGVKGVMPMVAVWDDHDIGQNDGGVDNPYKQKALSFGLLFCVFGLCPHLLRASAHARPRTSSPHGPDFV